MAYGWMMAASGAFVSLVPRVAIRCSSCNSLARGTPCIRSITRSYNAFALRHAGGVDGGNGGRPARAGRAELGEPSGWALVGMEQQGELPRMAVPVSGSVRHAHSPVAGSLWKSVAAFLGWSEEKARALVAFGGVYYKPAGAPTTAKPKRELDPERAVEVGEYLRIFTDPRRYPGCVGIEWEARIVYESSGVMLVNKPAGVPSHATVDNFHENMLAGIRKARPELELYLPHRLDIDTSGLSIVAKDAETLRAINEIIKRPGLSVQVPRKQNEREMIETHLSPSPFGDMACEDYEDESENVLARAFGIVAEMAANGIEPDNNTYRALLHFCKDIGCCEVAVLLLEEARRSRTKLNLFSFDLLIATMSEQGYGEMSTMLYEMAVVEGERDLLELEAAGTSGGGSSGGGSSGGGSSGEKPLEWPEWPMKGQSRGVALELHNLTTSTAMATVQIALLDVSRKPPTRMHWSEGGRHLRVITGMGNNSRDQEAVIKPVVMDMLEKMGLKPEFQQQNEGCIELKPANLEAYALRIKSQGAAAAPAC